jgi:mismatch-specific thymine-DNA glycosylase
MTAAVAGRHFVRRSNRFWRVIHLAGFTPEEILPENDRTILQYGYGLTTVVDRPTASADQLSRQEFVAAAAPFEQKIAGYAPRFVGFLGKAAYSVLSDQREIAWGPQPLPFGNAAVWVLPNPSGRNRAFTLDQLVNAYRQFYRAINLADSRPGNKARYASLNDGV